MKSRLSLFIPPFAEYLLSYQQDSVVGGYCPVRKAPIPALAFIHISYIGTTIALPIPVLAEDLIAQFWAKLPSGLWLPDPLHYYVCLSSGQSRPPRFSI